ncbi:hypothetical protein AIOL_002347 [Candidatus Rhodobacter oscarellae]|uniref:DUF4833 domain-containing protein n=1 Tax=Candidatus Rhodobacter oscarellae TaxID=1675527 RepID=A0A0J9E6C7_9RHOB|nr:hypothetical protein AIOL_002347 [Candidatus Rhodobacter lobularis]
MADFFVIGSSEDARAVRLESQAVRISDALPAVRPDWPVPKEPGQIFYIQRSINSNTVVYTARYDRNGNLKTRPGRIMWRRYNDAGERKRLKAYEHLAFGLNYRKLEQPGHFLVSLRALPRLTMELHQSGPNKAELIATIGGRQTRARYAYVTVDESGLLPKVTELKLFGVDIATGQAVSETFRVLGGGFRY